MLKLISRWTKTSPSIVVVRTLLQIDPTCPTELEALLADDCQKPLIHSNIPLHSVATPSGPDRGTEKLGDIPSGIVSIIGTSVGVLVALTIIVIIIIGCVVLKAKRARTHENW